MPMKADTRRVADLPAVPKSVSMQGGRRLWDWQFRRYTQMEALQAQGYTHVSFGGGKPQRIETAMREAERKSGGVVGFEERSRRRNPSSPRRRVAPIMWEGHFNADLTKLTKAEHKTAIGWLADLPLKELRRRQRLLQVQQERAYERRNTDALNNLNIMDRHLAAAIDRVAFRGAKRKSMYFSD